MNMPKTPDNRIWDERSVSSAGPEIPVPNRLSPSDPAQVEAQVREQMVGLPFGEDSSLRLELQQINSDIKNLFPDEYTKLLDGLLQDSVARTSILNLIYQYTVLGHLDRLQLALLNNRLQSRLGAFLENTTAQPSGSAKDILPNFADKTKTGKSFLFANQVAQAPELTGAQQRFGYLRLVAIILILLGVSTGAVLSPAPRVASAQDTLATPTPAAVALGNNKNTVPDVMTQGIPTPTPAPTAIAESSPSVSPSASEGNPDITSAETVTYTLATVLNDANLRSGPGTTNPIVGGVKSGDELRVLGENQDGNWVQIQWEAGDAWIAAFLVKQRELVVSSAGENTGGAVGGEAGGGVGAETGADAFTKKIFSYGPEDVEGDVTSRIATIITPDGITNYELQIVKLPKAESELLMAVPFAEVVFLSDGQPNTRDGYVQVKFKAEDGKYYVGWVSMANTVTVEGATVLEKVQAPAKEVESAVNVTFMLITPEDTKLSGYGFIDGKLTGFVEDVFLYPLLQAVGPKIDSGLDWQDDNQIQEWLKANKGTLKRVQLLERDYVGDTSNWSVVKRVDRDVDFTNVELVSSHVSVWNDYINWYDSGANKESYPNELVERFATACGFTDPRDFILQGNNSENGSLRARFGSLIYVSDDGKVSLFSFVDDSGWKKGDPRSPIFPFSPLLADLEAVRMTNLNPGADLNFVYGNAMNNLGSWSSQLRVARQAVLPSWQEENGL